MRHFISSLALLTALSQAPAQVLLDPSRPNDRRLIDAFEANLAKLPESRLQCRVSSFGPAPDFGLRLWSGFSATLPAAQFDLTHPVRAVSLFRVAPKRQPARAAYFWRQLDIPSPTPPPSQASLQKVSLSFGGGFFLGPGRYSVEWLLIDSKDRACRHSWSLNARGKNIPTPPDTVESSEVALWSGFPVTSASASGPRATIFIHAAPVWPRRYVSRLSPYDRQILLSSLNALLRDGGFSSAGVVVFDLHRRNIIFREPDFNRTSLRRLARQLAQVDFSTIDLDTLAQGADPSAFLERMLRAETALPTPSAAFVFIGTRWRAGDKPRNITPALKESLPPSWSLSFTTPQLAADPDSISALVRDSGGKVFAIYRPSDLASAIRQILNARLSSKPPNL